MAMAALFAVLGHMFPVWLKFRGGKGVATGLGSFVVIAPKAVLIAAGIFVPVVVIFRYVSLGSILAVASFPFLVPQGTRMATRRLGPDIHGGHFPAHHRQASRKYPPPACRHGKPHGSKARMSEIAIIGAGAWGTALSIVLGRKETHRIRLWAHEKEVCDTIAQQRVNEKFLPGMRIPACVTPCNDFAEALAEAAIVVSVMPSQHCRRLFEQMRPHLRAETMIVSATKGLEEISLLRMTEVIAQMIKCGDRLDPRIGALSGPSFALEAARGDPTAITIASQDAELARTVQQEFSNASFRIYTNEDPIGVELGGALKNTDRDCRRRLRGPWLGTQFRRGPHHAGLGGDDAAGGGLRRQSRNHGRPRGSRRPGADLHRRALPQSQCGRRTGPRTQVAGDPCRDAWHGCGRNLHHDGRGGTGARSRCRDAHHRTDARHPARGQSSARSNL